MKILFLTNIPSPYRVDFFNELGKYCDLTVLYERSNAVDRNNEWLKNEARTFKEVYLKGFMFGNDSAFCFSALKWLKNKSFDIIVVGGYSTPTGMLAIEYLRINKIPFILNCDGGMLKNENKFRYLIKKHFIRSASAWLSTSKVTNEYLLRYGAKIDKIFMYPFTSIKNEDILQEPINEEKKLEIKRKLNIKEDKIIISVGQFIYRKGFDVLIKACSILDKETGVYIVGGEPTNEYKELKAKLNLKNVHFIGFKSKEDLSEYYKAADLFVLPTRLDIWGLVVNEAMAYGLPIITTSKCVAGLELVKNNENGYIVPIEDEISIVEKVNAILNDDSLRNQMSINSIKKAKYYVIENMANVHIDIFTKTLKLK